MKVIWWASIINEGKRKPVESRGGDDKKEPKKYSSPGDFLPTKVSSALHIFFTTHTVTTLIFESTHSAIKLILWLF